MDDDKKYKEIITSLQQLENKIISLHLVMERYCAMINSVLEGK